MRALSTFLHATSDTASALLNMASIAIAAGAVAAACTARLRIGLIVGACALIIAAAGFGLNLWRTYGPSTRRQVFLFRRPVIFLANGSRWNRAKRHKSCIKADIGCNA